MEWIGYLIVILVVVLVIFINGAVQERKAYQLFLVSLKENFGKKAVSNISQAELDRIAIYHAKQKELGRCGEFCLDDITWNDLSMDDIFLQVNVTQSSLGEEYLYHLLRCPRLSEEGREEWDSLVAFFKGHETERMEIQKLFHRLGKINKISLTEVLYFLMDLKRESNLLHYVIDAALLLSFCVIFITPGAGVLLFLTVLAVSIISYFKRKGEISSYFTTFFYILTMLRVSQQIKKLGYEQLAPYGKRIEMLIKCFGNLEKGTYVLSAGTHTTSNPLELLMDYVRMLFHVDIIKFNSMLKLVQERMAEIEQLREVLGRLDAAIAAASYECSLAYSCAPHFDRGAGAVLIVEEACHPLVEAPVANSIRAESGILITGSNASGKSTFLKTMAICAILAQTIGIVPAKFYSGPLFRIFSSMALRDSLMTKESYYIVEIKSLKRIVDAGETKTPMLCFVDEVLRGTNTVERIAASSQILKSLARPHILCFAATHDIELTEMLEGYYANYHFDEEVLQNDVVFSYHLQSGRAETRNAIKLLSIIGYDPSVIARAEETAADFIKTGSWRMEDGK
ncbi:MAG: hypothetical protein QM697_03510 [Lachnospiraceae bacterium]